MPPSLGLRVNGLEFAGWETARITRSLEAAASGFDLSVSNRWGGQEKPWEIYEEDECILTLAGKPIIAGYVDKRTVSIGPETHSISVSGRDRTGELVDCSANLLQWEFWGTPILTIAQRLAAPFGVTVSIQPGVVPAVPEKVSIDPGDSALDVIERMCRMAALLPISDGTGNLILTRPGVERATTELVQGQNILEASGNYDASNKFRRYVVRGQHFGYDELNGGQSSGIEAEATDSTVRRSARVLLIRPEGNATDAQSQKRAQWEATVRAARSDVVTIKVQGWQMGDGRLWPINALARVRCPAVGADGDMLICDATYNLDISGGVTTELKLKGPDAYKPKPVIVSVGAWKELRGGVSVPTGIVPQIIKPSVIP